MSNFGEQGAVRAPRKTFVGRFGISKVWSTRGQFGALRWRSRVRKRQTPSIFGVAAPFCHARRGQHRMILAAFGVLAGGSDSAPRGRSGPERPSEVRVEGPPEAIFEGRLAFSPKSATFAPGARPGWDTGFGVPGGVKPGPRGPFRGPFLPRLWRFRLEKLGCVLDALPGWGAGFRALGKPRNRRRGVRQRAELSPMWHFCSNAGLFSAEWAKSAKRGEESHLFRPEIGEFGPPACLPTGPRRSRGARPAPRAPFLADFAALAGEGQTRLGSAVSQRPRGAKMAAEGGLHGDHSPQVANFRPQRADCTRTRNAPENRPWSGLGERGGGFWKTLSGPPPPRSTTPTWRWRGLWRDGKNQKTSQLPPNSGVAPLCFWTAGR